MMMKRILLVLILLFVLHSSVFAEIDKNLQKAIDKNDIRTVKELMAQGVDINSSDSYGCTPLMLAAGWGRIEITRLLIKSGATYDSRYLRSFAAAGLNDLVEELIKKGADINAVDEYGYTALMLAADNGHTDTAILEINNGAKYDAKYKTKYGSTYLQFFAKIGLNEYIKELLNQGADINGKSKGNDTALKVASEMGHVETVRLLLVNGVDVNEKDNNGYTALKLAAMRGHAEVAKLLINNGAEYDNDYIWAFASAGLDEFIEELINRGAAIDKQDFGYTPLMYALKSGHTDTAKLLIEHGANVNNRDYNKKTPLIQAVERRDVNTVNFLVQNIKYQADFNIEDEQGQTALMIAEKNGYQEISSLLRKREGNINVKNILIILALLLIPAAVAYFICARLEMDMVGRWAYITLVFSVISVFLFFPHAFLGSAFLGFIVAVLSIGGIRNIQLPWNAPGNYDPVSWSGILVGIVALVASVICFGGSLWLSKVLTGETLFIEYLFSVNIIKIEKAYYLIGILGSLLLYGLNIWLFFDLRKKYK